jgi:hypothetical protein
VSDERDNQPIIVGGCFRSGTSLVRRLLDSHPRIYCGPEVKFFADLYNIYLTDPIRHVRFTRTAQSMISQDEVLEVLGGAFVEMHVRAARHATKPRWADKAPENVIFLDRWQQLLGDGWLFLHVLRNPLDTLASIKENPFPVTIPSDLDARIDLWLDYLQAGLRFERDAPERYVRVVYEKLTEAPESSVRAMMQALGEELDESQLQLDNTRHQAGIEDPKVRQSSTIHSDSVEQWRKILSRKEIRRITERALPAWEQIAAPGA